MGKERNRKYHLHSAIVCFVAAATIAGTAVVSSQRHEVSEPLVLALLGVACALPAVRAGLRGRMDPFEPIYAFALSTFVYFVFVPAVLVRQNAFKFLGVDYTSELARVTWFAFLALMGFSIGYYLLGAATRGASEPRGTATLPGPELRRLMYSWALAFFAFFSVLLALWIVIARIPLRALWIFGEASYGDAWALATGPQIGYLYGVRESLPACLLLIIGLRERRRWPLVTLGLLALTVLFFAGSGARFRVLLLVLGVAIFYFLERGTRPRTWQSLLAGFVIYYFVIGGIGFYRSKTVEGTSTRGRSLGRDILTLDDAWDTMLGSTQIAVSTSMLVRAVPEYRPYFWGASFLNFLTQPIPRFLWPGKPHTIGEEFFDQLWPPGTTAPFWALFYINFGPVGIVLGMATWGWFSRRIYDAYVTQPGHVVYQVQLAVYWPFLIHMYGRGGDNFAFNFYGLVVLLFPVWVMQLLTRLRPGQSRLSPTGSSMLRADSPGPGMVGAISNIESESVSHEH